MLKKLVRDAVVVSSIIATMAMGLPVLADDTNTNANTNSAVNSNTNSSVNSNTNSSVNANINAPLNWKDEMKALKERQKEERQKLLEEKKQKDEVKRAATAACMSPAIDKRDNAIIAALDVRNAALKTALTARRDALKSAWSLTDLKARKDAIKTAWKAWSTSSWDAIKDFRTAKRAAWKTFYADRKACGNGASSVDNAAEGADAQL